MRKRFIFISDNQFILTVDHYQLTGSVHGNPDGIPVLYLHGGPGYRCDEEWLGLFNLKKYRVIFINQRGSSNSFPIGDIHKNTTWDLIDDLEKLRNFLNIEKWEILGKSWGTTLAMVYGIKFPERVSRITMLGVFLGREKDIDWLYNSKKLGSYSFDNVKYHQDLLQDPVGINSDEDPLKSYAPYILADQVNLELAVKWALWEDINCGAKSEPIVFPKIDSEYIRIAMAISRVEIHYFINNCFLEPDWILSNIKAIKCPVIMIQGEEDRICPKEQAIEVYRALDSDLCKLYLIPNSGHQFSQEIVNYLQTIFS